MKIALGKFSVEADLKLTAGNSSIDLDMLLRLLLPPILFVCLCTAIFLGFFFLLLPVLDPLLPDDQIGWVWLSLLVLYLLWVSPFSTFSPALSTPTSTL
jgi:hypothetical protein